MSDSIENVLNMPREIYFYEKMPDDWPGVVLSDKNIDATFAKHGRVKGRVVYVKVKEPDSAETLVERHISSAD